MTTTNDQVHEQVRQRYAAAAQAVSGIHADGGTALAVVDAGRCCAPAGAMTDAGSTAGEANASCCGGSQVDVAFGSGLYSTDQQSVLPAVAVAASLGCGNPTAVADLRSGERVLDLGSGGGIDVLLSGRRVGPTGFVYGVDMTPEMLNLARANAEEAGAANVAFLQGTIEDVPLPDGAVDVVISNCVINLSPDKPAVLAEMYRVLAPGGRTGISDVVAEDHLSAADRADRGSYVGCVAGALSRSEYLAGLFAAGFTDATVEFTHEVAPGMRGAIVRATKPVHPSLVVNAGAATDSGLEAGVETGAETGVDSVACCSPDAQASCCEASAKAACCGTSVSSEAAPAVCGCR